MILIYLFKKSINIIVVYLEHSRRTRIISARPATCNERKLYEQA